MTRQEIAATLQAFSAAGADRGLFYLSTPITSGRRELELMEKLGVKSRQEFRSEFYREWRELVVEPNERAATEQADMFVDTTALGRIVVNPARIYHQHWGQSDYDELWTRLIKDFPTAVVPLDDWAFSRGARLEVALAVRLRLPVLNFDGSRKGVTQIQHEVDVAEETIAARGWSQFVHDLPGIDFPEDCDVVEGEATLIPAPEESFARQAFVWLVKEHAYQVRKFGTSLDDDHTASGALAPDGWWSRQLNNYYHRARILGLENLVGRQALAKYVATACGLLESVIRVHGELPPPGVPSGYLGGTTDVQSDN